MVLVGPDDPRAFDGVRGGQDPRLAEIGDVVVFHGDGFHAVGKEHLGIGGIAHEAEVVVALFADGDGIVGQNALEIGDGEIVALENLLYVAENEIRVAALALELLVEQAASLALVLHVPADGHVAHGGNGDFNAAVGLKHGLRGGRRHFGGAWGGVGIRRRGGGVLQGVKGDFLLRVLRLHENGAQ